MIPNKELDSIAANKIGLWVFLNAYINKGKIVPLKIISSTNPTDNTKRPNKMRV
jgi:hypothetical protein